MMTHMEHTHKFELADGAGCDGERLAIIVNGTVNGTAYHVEIVAKLECGDCYVCDNRKSLAKDLRRELEPLRQELTSEDYREVAGELIDEAKEYAGDYFRETNHRYTPA